MYFPDFEETGRVYHIIPIQDLNKTITCGISFDDKISYQNQYFDFHNWIDQHKPHWLPKWVIRKKAIFATMNYHSSPSFHSHSAVLAIRVNPKRCWIANESRANQLYEPFILRHTQGLEGANQYLKTKGAEMIKEYWETSLSFEDNLKKRRDLTEKYDAEVLVMESIPPEDIEIRYIISDHRLLTPAQWKRIFCM
ncbi:hypothetical protein [Alkaliphilus crotonatoxidans]